MKFLTIDTTTKVTTLALAEDGRLVGENFLLTSKTHSERLIPMLDQLLQAAGWDAADLDFIGAARGPGSFTGIRIGLATAQGLAQVLQIPTVGVLSLDALAWAATGRTEEIHIILDARKNEWYNASYHWNAVEQTPVCTVMPRAVQPQKLIEEISSGGKRVVFAGDAVPKAKDFLQAELGEQAMILPDYLGLPRGGYTVQAVWQQWLANRQGETILPYYLRKSEAEVNYAKKHGIRRDTKHE